jgi:peptidoglycan/xylan/chitin deacetylase (PgdA/CDA1 family)
MKLIPSLGLLLLTLSIGCKDAAPKQTETVAETIEQPITSKPTVSFTFDDGITADQAGLKFEDWNQMMLSHLKEANLKAVFFVTGKNKQNEKGRFLLDSWNDDGHHIANHSFSHPNFNSEKNTAQLFEKELQQTDAIISDLSNSVKLFRFPYLKEGENALKVDSIRTVLANNKYTNGYVTIDASDWYVNQRLLRRIKEAGMDTTEINRFKEFYLQHIIDRANYYESLSYELNKRHINHTLLLHHNLSSALFLGDLIKKFKAEGWAVIDADKAYEDDIFKNVPAATVAGESLIYSLAKQSGNYDESLRYPAEDSRFEKDKMDALGL